MPTATSDRHRQRPSRARRSTWRHHPPPAALRRVPRLGGFSRNLTGPTCRPARARGGFNRASPSGLRLLHRRPHRRPNRTSLACRRSPDRANRSADPRATRSWEIDTRCFDALPSSTAIRVLSTTSVNSARGVGSTASIVGSLATRAGRTRPGGISGDQHVRSCRSRTAISPFARCV